MEIHISGDVLIIGLIDTDGTLIKEKHEYYSFTNKNREDCIW